VVAKKADYIIPRLAVDLKNELPDEKGFSERNIKRMLRFYREYPDIQLSIDPKVPQAVAQIGVMSETTIWTCCFSEQQPTLQMAPMVKQECSAVLKIKGIHA
jgi:hypothetical protein